MTFNMNDRQTRLNASMNVIVSSIKTISMRKSCDVYYIEVL